MPQALAAIELASPHSMTSSAGRTLWIDRCLAPPALPADRIAYLDMAGPAALLELIPPMSTRGQKRRFNCQPFRSILINRLLEPSACLKVPHSDSSGTPYVRFAARRPMTRPLGPQGRRRRWQTYFTRRFSADSLPRFGTVSNVTLAPSGRPSRPAFSTAEIWTKTSLPPPSGRLRGL